jgi:hypothetical protein
MAKPKKGKHYYWTTLIEKLERMRVKEVQMIVIKPIKPRIRRKGTNHYYDRIAYIFGKGSEYFAKYKHQEDCTWYSVD